ncbi:GGDEF domain-containing protein [Vibrio sp. LaRot3]|uniref:GGDEF domain-containing protein n=1 Tax=Vibrio sp. LaRot3 TaxID=2998829 RepID=UPI0022CDDB4E|nr:GGDEF domain-containing protein [Vibrio sp. LaRot3]MDA0147248.1 GGDEF domain-containing protein [Vibrio sp. LaRot3]
MQRLMKQKFILALSFVVLAVFTVVTIRFDFLDEMNEFHYVSNQLQEDIKANAKVAMLLSFILSDAELFKPSSQRGRLDDVLFNSTGEWQDKEALSLVNHFAQQNPIFFDEDTPVRIRLRKGKQLLSNSSEELNPEEYERTFQSSYCLLKKVCQKYTGAYPVKDGVAIGHPYYDHSQARWIISLLAPITANGKVIGDVIVDTVLPDAVYDVSSHSRASHLIKLVLGSKPTWHSTKLSYTLDNIKSLVVYKDLVELWLRYGLLVLLSSSLFIAIAIYVAKVDRVKMVARTALYDPLTQVYNRKVLESDELAQELISHKQCALFCVDGNRIKAINDAYGHHIGDLAIQAIAHSLQSGFRSSDFVIRMGGDEFIVIAPSFGQQRIKSFVPHLKNHIRSQTPAELTLQDEWISASIGVSTFSGREELQAAIKLADERLYQDKPNYISAL